MHVLIVEEDAALGDFLAHGIQLEGHEVSVVPEGGMALHWAERLRPELMILDLKLPGRDELVLAEIGERFRSTAVMVLTGWVEMEERVRCLELGADDVVLKPFSFHELRARLKVLCRRRERFEETVLRFADLEMDRAERKVTQDGREVQLTATEFSLLESLMRRRGERICGREELLREVWRAPAGMGTNIVEVYINYLRRKLGQSLNRSGRSRSLIRTVRGKGYVLADRGSQMAESWSEIEDLERKAG